MKQKNWNRQMWALEALAADNTYDAVTAFETEQWDTGHVYVKRVLRHRFQDGTVSRSARHESYIVGKRGGVKPNYNYTDYGL